MEPENVLQHSILGVSRLLFGCNKSSAFAVNWRSSRPYICKNVNSHRIHVWYIYLHFMVNVGKYTIYIHIYHTRILWDYINEPRIMNLFLNDALMTPTALEPENTTDVGVAITGIAYATTQELQGINPRK